jgi:hypothetical protein
MASRDQAEGPLFTAKAFQADIGEEVSVKVINPSFVNIQVEGGTEAGGRIHVGPSRADRSAGSPGITVSVDRVQNVRDMQPIDLEISAGTRHYRETIVPGNHPQKIQYSFFYGESEKDLVWCEFDGIVVRGSCPHT